MNIDELRSRAEGGSIEDQIAFVQHIIDVGNDPEADKDAFRYATKAAEAGLAEGQYLLGWLYHNGRGTEQICTKAAYWYHKAVDQNHSKASLQLGHLYNNGSGVDKDEFYAKALYFDAFDAFRANAAKGDAEAWSLLGTMWQHNYGVPEDRQEAFLCYSRAADLGCSAAHVDVGYMLEKGLGTERDLAQAVKHYRVAADAGNSYGRNNLGNCLLDGRGIEAQPEEGFRLLIVSAHEGLSLAENGLAWAYEKGIGCEADLSEAIHWYRAAAVGGDSDAVQNLLRLYESESLKDTASGENAVDYRIFGTRFFFSSYGLARDDSAGFKHIHRAAELGDVIAQDWLSWAYASGRGCIQDHEQAFFWASKAAEKEYAPSLVKLGVMYSEGNACEQSDYRAFECFKHAAALGSWDGMDKLGCCFRDGRGTERDVDQAWAWFLEAAECGYARSLVNLVTLYAEHGITKVNDRIVCLTCINNDVYYNGAKYLSGAQLARFQGLRRLHLSYQFSKVGDALLGGGLLHLRSLWVWPFKYDAQLRWPSGLQALDLDGCKGIDPSESEWDLSSMTRLRALRCSPYDDTLCFSHAHIPTGIACLHLESVFVRIAIDGISSGLLSNVKELKCMDGINVKCSETIIAGLENTVVPSSVLSLCLNSECGSRLPCFAWDSELRELAAAQMDKLGDITTLKACRKLVKLDLSSKFWYSFGGGLSHVPNRITSLDAISDCRRLATLNLKGSSNIFGIEALRCCTSLEELDLTACWRIREVRPLASLPRLRSLNLNRCTNIRDVDSLGVVAALVELQCDADPYGAEAVRIATAILRRDRDFVRNNVSWAQGAVQFPKQAEILFGRWVRALSLFAEEDWAFDGLWKLLAALRRREGLESSFWRDAFCECLKLPSTSRQELFCAVLDGVEAAQLADTFLRPVLAVLADSADIAGEWATELIDGLLAKVEKHRLSTFAADICLFYAKSQKEGRLREWLNRFTDEMDTGWLDQIHVELALWEIATGRLDDARARLPKISGTDEQDCLREALVRKLAAAAPAEAGDLLEEIEDEIRKSDLANALAALPEFTTPIENVYRLFLSLESSPERMAELIKHLTRQHPDSLVVKSIAGTFRVCDAAEAPAPPAELGAAAVLSSAAIADLLSPRMIRQLSEEAGRARAVLTRDAARWYVQGLIDRGIIGSGDAEHILREIHGGPEQESSEDNG